ncbi:MAG TPA: DUF2254 domain-containing protein [Woeseiaceae bacterium]|nr:DUF2254 domain-containing protein [Woeseiaceae bacterium]
MQFYLNRIKERLWLKPLIVAVFSVIAALTARTVDRLGLEAITPKISTETNISLLEIMASSMLVIATFAVGSMITAYSSASNTATPRSFPLVLADDTSQTALSSFIGAFIFSIVSLVALYNSYYGHVARFALFLLILAVFSWVVFMFVKWVDNIARLGRLGNTVDKVEATASRSLQRRRDQPALGGVIAKEGTADGKPVYARTFGYVQQVDVAGLQAIAEASDCEILVQALPGKFAGPKDALALIRSSANESEVDSEKVAARFRIGDDRVFDDDPRFALIVLSEIAGRALSPAVNDPGTAIDILGTFVRLFAAWVAPQDDKAGDALHDRVFVPLLDVSDLVDDAFSMIMREGAGSPAVAIRLQKSFAALASLEDDALQAAVRRSSRMSLTLSEKALQLEEDIVATRGAAQQVQVDDAA